MKSLRATLFGVLLALASSTFAAYTARMWFEDHTTGQSGAGAINASPGDEIWVNYSFASHSTRPDVWTVLQVYIDVSATCCLSDTECNTWDNYVTNVFGTTNYPTKIVWQCSDGDMYNDAVDPSDMTQAFLTHKGLYALIGVKGTARPAQNISVTVFKFHISCGGTGATDLRFGRRPGQDASGIWTQLIDQNNELVDVARGVTETGSGTYTYGNENWVRCCPEPGAVAAVVAGVVGLAALRRRK